MKTTLNGLKCLVLGHKYVSVTVHNLDKHKKEYWYQCVRCGHRSLFSNLRDTILNKILISKLKVSPLNKTNIMKQIQLCVPDDQAELFAEKLAALVKECGGDIDTSNKPNPFLYNDKIPIWERIKTVEDAIAITGMTLPDNIDELPLDVQAMLKLRIICAAYNELKADQLDQFPKFTPDEYRYYPWFYLYTQEEIDAMTAEDRSRVLGRSLNDADAGAGVAYSGTNYASSYSVTSDGGRLCFKTEKLASECGKRFTKLWGQFFAFLTE